ncbi:MAG: GatB/YqeY domain-containing protein [SAR202 cluster bacterium]|nr:GatB/YqeY domain-containing protein [SAR202 cluster bacterium]
MSLRERLDEDMKQAMRSKDADRLLVIRHLRSEIKYQEIERQKPSDDAAIAEMLSKQAQKRRESIEMFKQGNRQDLVDKEEAQLKVIMEYLPKQMTEAEVRVIAEKTVAEVGAKGPQDIGKVMGKLAPQLKGKADGKMINEVVQSILKRQ